MRSYLLCIICTVHSIAAYSSALTGMVTDEANRPLPYANVYIKGTTSGATTNTAGQYSLTLRPGTYQLIFSYVGYLQQTREVIVGEQPVQLNVQLQPEQIELKEVVVTAGAEDPAYRVIRAAIKNRSDYLDQPEGFSSRVYIKGIARLDSTPKTFMGYNLEKKGIDSSMLGIIYLSESESEYHFRRPGDVKEVMLSSKVSGDANGFSWNKASDFDFNFYKNLVDAGMMSNRQFISPISETALLYYRYRLVGTFYEERELINKIEVIPRRKGDPVFSGFIYIVEDSWRIHSTDLWLKKDANLDFVDSLKLAQMYARVNDTLWMPYSQTMHVFINALGFRMKANFAGVFTDYKIDPDFPAKFFSGEVWKINEDANTKDSLYWISNRPVPLTDEESADYEKKDSLSVLQNSKPYLDSIDRENNQFAAADLVFGYQYYRRYTKTNYHTSGLLGFINYNTVEGFAPSIRLGIDKRWEDKRLLKLSATFRYGFSNHEPSVKFKAAYLFDPLQFSSWKVEGGRFVQQFNEANPISPLINTAYTLFAGENYMKLYMNSYGKVAYETEIVNGIQLSAGTSYNHRTVLENTTDYSFVSDSNIHFTVNDPQFASCDGEICFTGYDAWLIQLKATIHFRQQYFSRPDEKINIRSKYPALTLSYQRGLPWLGSEVNFDQLTIGVEDHYKLGTFGEGDYRLEAGAFLTNANVGAAEFQHFNGNQTIFAQADRMHAFQLLPYYTYSTDQWHLAGHLEHHFHGLVFNHIPLIRKLKFEEVAGVHYLQTPDLQYVELSIGIEHILKVLRVDFVAAYSNQQQFTSGFLIGLTLGGGGVVSVSVDE